MKYELDPFLPPRVGTSALPRGRFLFVQGVGARQILQTVGIVWLRHGLRTGPTPVPRARAL
jgi:hypothetical protein